MTSLPSTMHAAQAGADRRRVLALGLATLALALAALFELPRSAWDLQAFAFINRGHVLSPALWSMLSVAGLGLSVFIALAWFAHRQPHWPLAFLICLLIAGGLTHAAKFALQAPRPAAVLPPDHLEIIGVSLKAHSMPSGHTVSAFACAAIVVLSMRRSAPHPWARAPWLRTALTLLALGAATLVGLSRIAVGAHWPSDVVVGAGLGWSCGTLALLGAERWRGPYAGPAWVWRTLIVALAQVGAGAAMLVIDTGYPLAQVFQQVLGWASVASAAWHGRIAWREWRQWHRSRQGAQHA